MSFTWLMCQNRLIKFHVLSLFPVVLIKCGLYILCVFKVKLAGLFTIYVRFIKNVDLIVTYLLVL